jgi:hypothetical protein
MDLLLSFLDKIDIDFGNKENMSDVDYVRKIINEIPEENKK